MSKEAMKLALEALQFALHVGFDESSESQIKKGDKAVQQHQKAITALREALAEQPAQQEQGRAHYEDGDVFERIAAMKKQPAQQEPVAWICKGFEHDEKHSIDYWPGDVDDLPIGTKLYTSPPAQRPWVGLTHEDIVIILNNDYGGSRADCIRAAEAKLKERNT